MTMSKKMNAEVFAVAISNLLFGFIFGLAIETISHKTRVESINQAMQRTIDVVFEKDTIIDDLLRKLKNTESQYNELYEAIEVSRSAFDRVLRVPTPEGPEPTCEPSNMD